MNAVCLTQEQLNKVTRRFLEILPPQDQQELRVQDYYLKVLDWVLSRVMKAQPLTHPLIIGVNGPQGSGKSTLTAALVGVFPELGLQAVTLSIDDFYLTRNEQLALAAAHPMNSLLQQRGYPGTHDIQLGLQILKGLRERHATSTSPGAAQPSEVFRVPSYDKSLHQGQGDRLPASQWTQIRGPLDVVFLEGWMLGFTPVAETVILENAQIRGDLALCENFQRVNRLLARYQSWYEHLDAFIHLIPQKIEYVVDWRVAAEEHMKAQGKPGMSIEEITTYINKFILAYQIYLPQLSEKAFLPGKTFSRMLSKERLPVASLRASASGDPS